MSRNQSNRQIKYRRTSRQNNRPLGYALLISAICHLLIFSAIVVATDQMPRRISPLAVMNVSLVSAPLPASPAANSRQPSLKSRKTSPTPRKRSKTDAISITSKKRMPKKSLKKKTFNPEKVVKKTLSKIEKKVEQSRPPALDETFDRLKRSVQEAEDQQRTKLRSDSQSASSVKGIYGKTGDQDQAVQDRLNIYHAEIAYHIRRNWVYSEQLAGRNSELETALGITILPSGEIKDIWFDQKSGNAHLDDSAYKAVLKSNPLPPLPANLFKSSYTIGLRFGPKGLK